MNTVSFHGLLIVVFQIIPHVSTNWVTGNLCWSMPCLNGGSCFGSAYTYLCICPINYSGALCEKRLGVCQENPCGNRGYCIEKSLTEYECRCYYDYIGPTCEEQVTHKNRNIWSSLLPIHTRILFEMLQEAYREKAREKPVLVAKNGQIDFLDLLLTTTTVPTTMEIVTTTVQTETSEKEIVIQANNIEFEKIFPNESTISTEQSSQSDSSITSEILENITTKPTEQIQSNYFDTTVVQEMLDIQTSTSIPWTNDDDNTTTINSTESIVITTTTQPIDSTSSNETSSSDPTTTTTTLPIHTTTDNAHSQLLYKLCQQIISHFSSNGSLALNSSIVHHNNTINTLLSWFNKHLNSSKMASATPTEAAAATLPSFIVNEMPSSAPLQRINMDDVLHQIDNYNDDENAHL